MENNADEQDEDTGRFLGLPYDWRDPSRERLKKALWNPDDRRVIVPKTYGWGYTLNFYEIGRRLRLLS